MAHPFTGGCACGAIRYEASIGPPMAGTCHCGDCQRASGGSVAPPLFGKPSMMPDVVGIRAGSLDNPSLFQPSMDIYTSSAQSWDYMNPDLPKFPKAPEQP